MGRQVTHFPKRANHLHPFSISVVDLVMDATSSRLSSTFTLLQLASNSEPLRRKDALCLHTK